MNSVKIGTTALVTNAYNNLTWNLLSQTYANGQKWTYEYYTHTVKDDSEPPVDVTHQSSELKSKSDGTNKFVYYYSNDGAVARIEYYSGTTLKQVEKYYYDTSDRLCRVVGLNGSTTEPSILYEYSWTYDNNNNVTNLVETIGGVKTTYNYGYNTEQQASSAAYGNTHKTFAYDGYGRFSNSIVYAGSVTADKERVKEYVEYKTTNGYATNQVSRFISKWSRNTSDVSSEIYQYTYDANGNITAIKDGNGNNLVTYQYDSNDQLIWERNYITVGSDTNGSAYQYTYDTGGNIKSKTTYSSADATSGGTPVSYTYDTTWGDKLTKVGSNAVTSDASGNITAYNGWTYTYKGGRQLAKAVKGSTTLNFTYNDAGLRTAKTGHAYTYNGSLLASDVTSSYALYFRYDQNGAPIGFGYKSSSSAAIVEYYYLKNLQGDITGIVDTSGNRVATYVYDAWGNHLSITGSNTDLANKNPLRYRGYQFDPESSLYYLQSRYYSPAIGRFISADSYAVTYSSASGANMFAYCLNNPVMGIDPTGEIVGTVFDVASWCVSVAGVAANPYDMWAWAGLIGDTIDLLPVVSGAGEAVKAVGAMSKTTEAFNALADARNASKAGKYSANMVGQIGESMAGISGKKQPININGRTRIPDQLTSHSLTEVKNVASLSNTQQLRDFAKYAKDNNLEAILFVRPTTKISKSVIDDGWTIKYLWR